MKKFTSIIFFTTFIFIGCYKEDPLNIPERAQDMDLSDPIDQHIYTTFLKPYNVIIRYNYVDRYVESDKRVTPSKREHVIPMVDFLHDYWIEPFVTVPNGKRFFEDHVPPELVFIGSSIYNTDGTITLGTADAGVRITLTEINLIDTTNFAWVTRQLGTLYHEFAHIMHQRYKLPTNWETISPSGYTSSGSWYNLSDEEALQRGFVSPYASSSFNEDYAEIVAHILFYPDFHEHYLTDELNCATVNCEKRNEGRAKLRQKYNAAMTHFSQKVKVDLELVREKIQAKLEGI
jgi:substrate import-associated zinc metallohydrolase lipoprotein